MKNIKNMPPELLAGLVYLVLVLILAAVACINESVEAVAVDAVWALTLMLGVLAFLRFGLPVVVWFYKRHCDIEQQYDKIAGNYASVMKLAFLSVLRRRDIYPVATNVPQRVSELNCTCEREGTKLLMRFHILIDPNVTEPPTLTHWQSLQGRIARHLTQLYRGLSGCIKNVWFDKSNLCWVICAEIALPEVCVMVEEDKPEI